MIDLYNGDCLEVMKQIQSKSVDCIVSDPPYGVNFKNNFYDDSTENVFKAVPEWFLEWHRILQDDSFLYLFVGVKTIHKWIQAGIDAGFTYKNIIASRSFNNGAIRSPSNFGFQFQPIVVFNKGNGRKMNSVDFIPTSESWAKDKRNKNPKEYTYDYPNWIKSEWAFANVKSGNQSFHPNEKNVDLIKFLIELSSNENEVILDPFMGSGTTGIACKNLNRNFIGIELDENYFEIAKKRIAETDND